MAEQTYGERRCRDSRKPALSECPEVGFYQCDCCKEIYTRIGMNLEDRNMSCCGQSMRLLVPKGIDELPGGISLDYKITGGYNDNTVLVEWKAEDYKTHPEWIFLKTFTGGYMKYLLNGKKSPMRFALADLDAFAYCDEDPCLECTFRCKRGFIIYVYYREYGLFHIPMDKFSPYWQSKDLK